MEEEWRGYREEVMSYIGLESILLLKGAQETCGSRERGEGSGDSVIEEAWKGGEDAWGLENRRHRFYY